jgi:N4-gp56 family major capsid protein
MSITTVSLGDPKACAKWSGLLAVDTMKQSYWTSRFMANGSASSAPLVVFNELSAGAGDAVSFDVSMQINTPPVEGEDILSGNETSLSFFTDKLYIDISRQAVNAGTRMSQQRTLHSLREVARRRLSDYFARLFDEVITAYVSGARGTNSDWILPTTWTGRANNALQAPDTDHLVYAGNATAKNDLDANDKVDLALIDRLVAIAKSMETTPIQPVQVDGGEKYVFVVGPWAEYSLRTSTGSDNSWVNIQRALASAKGRDSELFKGALGEYAGVVLHVSPRTVQFDDYGNPATVKAARGLFLGHQAGAIAFGSGSNRLRFNWVEDTADLENQIIIAAHAIWGCKKVRFDSKDFGVIAVDYADPRG